MKFNFQYKYNPVLQFYILISCDIDVYRVYIYVFKNIK